MTWFRVGGAGIPASLKNAMNAVFNKKFGTSGQNYPPKQWPDDVNLMGPLPEGTASGNVAHITDGADLVPIKKWNCSVNGNTNGVSLISCSKFGKNMFSYDLPLYEGYWLNGFQGTGNEVNYDTSNGWLFYKIPVSEGDTITFSGMQAMGGVYCAFFKDTPDNVISTFLNGSINGSRQVPTGANFVGVEINRGGNPQRDPKNEFPYAQIEISSSSTSFEAFSKTEYSVLLGRTIYGGVADIVNGRGYDSYNLITVGNSGWTYYESNGNSYMFRTFDDKIIPQIGDADHELACDMLPYGGVNYASQFQDLHIYQANNKNIYIKDTSCQSASDYYSKYSAMKIAYENTSPNDFTFQPLSDIPETPLGVSNWWNNTGDSEVVYRRDIDLAIQAVSSSRGLMMASRPVTQLVGEESDPDQVNELVEDDENYIREQLNEVVENDETEQEGENDAR